jgi:hypothetical protein
MFSTRICYVSTNYSHYLCNVYNLVLIMTNIKLLTPNEYSTWDISFFYVSLLGDILEDILKLTRNGVGIGLQFYMLKHCKIFSNNYFLKAKYFFYFCLCKFTSLESCLMVLIRSFIPNSLTNYVFNSWTRSLLRSIINMPSIYNKIIKLSFSLSLFAIHAMICNRLCISLI